MRAKLPTLNPAQDAINAKTDADGSPLAFCCHAVIRPDTEPDVVPNVTADIYE